MTDALEAAMLMRAGWTWAPNNPNVWTHPNGRLWIDTRDDDWRERFERFRHGIPHCPTCTCTEPAP